MANFSIESSPSSQPLNLNVSSILERLETSPPKKATDSNEEEVFALPLSDVTAFLDARGENSNLGKAVARELELMGADISDTLNERVTHVVFKDGFKRTLTKAKKLGVHVVSILWVDGCKKNNAKLSETMFSVELEPGKSRSPDFSAKWKKKRSMQPKPFEEEVAQGAQRFERKLRRQKGAPRGQTETDDSERDSPAILERQRLLRVLELDVEQLSTPELEDSPSHSVPDTPDTVKMKLDSVRRQRFLGSSEVDNSPIASLSTPLQRRLFAKQFGSSPSVISDSESDISLLSPSSGCKSSPMASPTPVSLKSLSSSSTRSRISPQQAGPSSCSPVTSSITCETLKGRHTSPLDPLSKKQANMTSSSSDVMSLSSPKIRGNKTEADSLMLKLNSIESEETYVENQKIPMTSKAKPKKRLANPFLDRPVETLLVPDSPVLKKPRPSFRSAARKGGKSEGFRDVTQSEQSEPRVSDTVSSTDIKKKPSRRSLLAPERNQISLPVKPRSLRRQSVSALTGPSCSQSVGNETGDESLLVTSASERKGDESAAPDRSRASDSCLELKVKTVPSNGRVTRRRSMAAAPHDSKLSESVFTATVGTPEVRKSRRVSVAAMCRVTSQNVGSLATKIPDKVDAVASQISDDVLNTSLKKNMRQRCEETPGLFKPKRKMGDKMEALSKQKQLQELTEEQEPVVKEAEKTEAQKVLTKKCLASTSRKAVKRKTSNSQISPQAFKRPNVSKKGSRSSSAGSESSPKRNPTWRKVNLDPIDDITRSCPSLVYTSLHQSEQNTLRSIVRKMGNFKIVDVVDDETTHVVCCGKRRTLNVLRAISRGLWLVTLDWALASQEQGKWADEEQFEVVENFPAASACRKARQTAVSTGIAYSQKLFSDCGPFWVSDDVKPPAHEMKELICLAGGQVTESVRAAGILVGAAKRKDIPAITEKWINDSIAHNALQSLKEYALNEKAKLRCPSPSY